MIIDYDNGIQYEIVPSLSEVGQEVSFTLDYEEWEDDGITFEPLGEKKACSRATIRVPEQLETETGKPLTVTYVINNKEYVYRLR